MRDDTHGDWPTLESERQRARRMVRRTNAICWACYSLALLLLIVAMFF